MKHNEKEPNDPGNENILPLIDPIKNEEGCEDSYHKDEKKQNNFFSSVLKYIVIILGIGIVVLIITLVLDKNNFGGPSYFKSDDLIIKPKSDFRKYRSLSLKNGLDVVMISDPLTVTAGASLSVGVGANNDPDTLLGLAHFCEHMLFLGNKKYPNGDDYFKIVTENNGHFNAYTDREVTNYFFDIHSLSFEKALDIFSRFFIDPLFNKDKINKEVNSVNSEFEKNLIIDTRKRSQVLAFLAEKDNPYNRFTTGNLKTLTKSAEILGLELRQELINFHKKFYVADKMKLVLFSNDDLDDLEDLVIEKFTSIKASQQWIMQNTENNKTKNLTLKLESQNNSTFTNNDSHSNEIFKNPFSNEILGSFVKFTALSMEHELSIIFIQKPLHEIYFFNNPFFYFQYLLEAKDENSLLDKLKKQGLATKLTVNNERDYSAWSDFELSITLTKKGVKYLDTILYHIKEYLIYMKKNLINEKYFNYLKKVSLLNFEYKSPHNKELYQYASNLGARLQKNPIQYLLDENHFVGNFSLSKKSLHEYAEKLSLKNSIVFLPFKVNDELFDIDEEYKFLSHYSKLKSYEPWYRTNFTSYKINFTELDYSSIKSEQLKKHKIISPNMLNSKNKKSHKKITKLKLNFTQPDLFDEHTLDRLVGSQKSDNIKSNFKIKNCYNNQQLDIEKYKKFTTSEPSLLNKTNIFEFWFKNEKTIDFNKTSINILLKYNKFENEEEKINILILETYLKRKLKKINSKLKFFSNNINFSNNYQGIKISFTTFDINLKEVTKEIVDKLRIIKMKEKIKDFESLIQEVHDHLLKEYNNQPWGLSYEYLKKNLLKEYTTSEEYLRILPLVSQDTFNEFLNKKFHENFFLKLLVIGDISEDTARNIFSEFTPILKMESITKNKPYVFSIKEKRKNRRVVFRKESGNFLLKKIYHKSENKNNALVKCYKIGKNNYKSELMVKLFNSIIGNIVFRELRINKQFGYVAKSRIEKFDNYNVSFIRLKN
jgi:secreted Zn-dependent insulinase-like peptidase